MDGLLTYSSIFYDLLSELSVLSNILNMDAAAFFNETYNRVILGITDGIYRGPFYSFMRDTLGLGDISVLGFLLSFLGSSFGVLAVVRLKKYFLD